MRLGCTLGCTVFNGAGVMGERIPPHQPPPHRSVTALALGKARAIAAPCHPAPRRRLRHRLYLSRPLPLSLLPRPRFATAPASINPLAGLRLAGGYRGGCGCAVAPAPTFARRPAGLYLPHPDCRSATRFGQYPRRVTATSARGIQGHFWGAGRWGAVKGPSV